MIVLTDKESIFFYIGIFLISVLFVFWGSNVKRLIGTKCLFAIALLPMFLLITFREIGIDRATYALMFEWTPMYAENYHLSGYMEPVYFLINLLVYKFEGNIFWVQAIQATIYLSAVYRFLLYSRVNKTSPFLVLVFHIGTLFFYMMGLNRLAISFGFFIHGFINFYKQKKVMPCFILSVLSHYSALIAVVLFWYIFIITNKKRKNHDYWIIGFLMPIAIGILLNFMAIGLKSILPGKYLGYIDDRGFHFEYLINLIYVLPLILIYLFFYRYNRVNEDNERVFWDKHMTLITGLTNMSILFSGAFRLSFFVNLLVGFMYDRFLRQKMANYKSRVVGVMAIGGIALIYCVITFFDSIYFVDHIFPVKLGF